MEQSPTSDPTPSLPSQTEQILHSHRPQPESETIKPELRPVYERLVRLRDQMIDRQNDLETKGREALSEAVLEEPSDIGTEQFLADYALGMASTEQEFLTEVLAAIDRIKGGTYGVCELTGKTIPIERLEAVPWARYTVEAQREVEEHGEATKAGIGARGSIDHRGTELPSPRREEEGSL